MYGEGGGHVEGSTVIKMIGKLRIMKAGFNYCAESGSGPPCLVGHSVFFELYRVPKPTVLG
jgi:hypothetical protein